MTAPDHLLNQLVRQCREDSKRWFPETIKTHDQYGDLSEKLLLEAIKHHTLAMVGEVGEFVNLVKKIDRGDKAFTEQIMQFDLKDELTDVFIYLLNLAALLDFDLLAQYVSKRKVNESRFGPQTNGKASNGNSSR